MAFPLKAALPHCDVGAPAGAGLWGGRAGAGTGAGWGWGWGCGGAGAGLKLGWAGA